MHVYGYYNIEEVSPWNSPWESPQPRHLLRMRTLLFTALRAKTGPVSPIYRL